MPRSLDIIFLLSFLSQVNPFRVEDTSLLKSGIYKNLVDNGRKIMDFDVPGHTNVIEYKDNEEINETIVSEADDNFINCKFSFEKNSQPDYVCTHGDNIKMEWNEKKDGYTGTVFTSINCSCEKKLNQKKKEKEEEKAVSANFVNQTQDNLVNNMQRLKIRDIRETRYLFRAKRLTIYHDDAEVDENTDASIQPEGNLQNVEDQDGIEDKTEEDPNKDGVKDEKEKMDGKEGNDTNEDGAKDEKEKVNEKEENGMIEDGVTDENEKVNEKEENEANKVIDEKEDKNKTEDKGEIDEEPLSAINEDGRKEEGNLGNDDKYLKFMNLVSLELGLTFEKLMNFTTSLQNIFAAAGDYILSLILRDLKHIINRFNIDVIFSKMVEKVSNSMEGDSEKAIDIVTKQICEQFGAAYEIELVKYLHNLNISFKF